MLILYETWKIQGHDREISCSFPVGWNILSACHRALEKFNAARRRFFKKMLQPNSKK